MGQYHLIVNIDKREYIRAHPFGHAMKLREMAGSANGALAALCLLLAADNGLGGGDFPDSDFAGHWAGDRIVIAGDYGEAERFVPVVRGGKADTLRAVAGEEVPNLYSYALVHFDDISERIAPHVKRE